MENKQNKFFGLTKEEHQEIGEEATEESSKVQNKMIKEYMKQNNINSLDGITKKYLVKNNTLLGIFYVDAEKFKQEVQTLLTTHEQQAVEKFLESQIEYEAEEYSVCPLCERELIWGETYCPDDRRKLITKTRNKLEWSNKNVVIKELTKFLEENPSA